MTRTGGLSIRSTRFSSSRTRSRSLSVSSSSDPTAKTQPVSGSISTVNSAARSRFMVTSPGQPGPVPILDARGPRKGKGGADGRAPADGEVPGVVAEDGQGDGPPEGGREDRARHTARLLPPREDRGPPLR